MRTNRELGQGQSLREDTPFPSAVQDSWAAKHFSEAGPCLPGE